MLKNKKQFRECLPPFLGYKSRGPYTNGQEGRLYIHIYKKGETPKTLLYARYLISVSKQEPLSEGMSVDHIDGNCFNDTITNLQILSIAENSRKGLMDPLGLLRRRRVSLICPSCGKSFTRRVSKTFLGSSTLKTYCSKGCKGKPAVHEQKATVINNPPPFIRPRSSELWEKWSLPIFVPKKETFFCSVCSKAFTPRRDSQKACGKECALVLSGYNRRVPKDKMDAFALSALEGKISWVEAGRQLGVSDNAVRKAAKKLKVAVRRFELL